MRWYRRLHWQIILGLILVAASEGQLGRPDLSEERDRIHVRA
jgi:hypothetical protein